MPDQRGRVGLALGELDREGRRAVHAVLEHDVAVNVDDADGDGHLCMREASASTRSAIVFARASKSMIGSFLSESEAERSAALAAVSAELAE